MAKEGYQPEYGARPLRRGFIQTCLDSLAEEMLRGEYKAGDADHRLRRRKQDQIPQVR
ncbi:MAG: hypothetical protein R3C24_12105 [Cyanobacteriota/Melainabacteria group bacterium]